MPFLPPDYNLTVDEWIPPNTPALGPPDRTMLRCQIYIDPRLGGIEQDEFSFGFYTPPIIFRHPDTLTRARGTIHNEGPGSTSYYRMVWSQVEHLGFPNQYIMAIHIQCNSDGSSPQTY